MTRLDEHGERIIAFVERYQETYCCSPSYEEIGRAVGLKSKDHVSRDLRKLKEQGYLSFNPGMSRSIVLSKKRSVQPPNGRRAAPNVSLGAIPGSKEASLQESRPGPLDWTSIARELVGEDQEVHVLRVQGDSMHDALVEDGDLVLINPKRTAQEGEMVAAWLKPQQEMTLKYFHRENGHVRLEPANPRIPPLQMRSSDVEIRGQVLAIVRKAR
jgi:repressor LexA